MKTAMFRMPTITTLLNNIIPGYVTIGNLGVYTHEVIEYILKWQTEKHWVLRECDFTKQFEYEWTREKLLAALFSVANRFVDKYMWIFDTKVYPYQISLKRFDENRIPDHYARKGHNRLRLSKQSDSRNLCTRLYVYGAGEGVNQLNIADLNNGQEYLQSPPEIVEKYGIIETPWTDRRYTDAQSLLESGRVMLNELQEPYEEYDAQMLENPKVGDIVQIVGGVKSYIVEMATAHDEVPQVGVKIANRPKDIAGSIADLADRLRIEMTYSQGATQVYAASMVDNADSKTPLNIPFYIPNDMININAVQCKIRLSQFRAYNTNLLSGGSTQTSSNGGSTTVTSGATATQYKTSDSGGSTYTSSGSTYTEYRTSESGGGGTSGLPDVNIATIQTYSDINNYNTNGPNNTLWNHTHSVGVAQHTHILNAHSHQFSIPGHSHSISINSHSHSFTIDGHSHSVTIGSHSHTVDTSHTHSITPQISFFGNPTSFRLLINGVEKATFNGRDAELDITQYLVKDRKIPRGTWLTIGVQPNDLARVEVSYNIKGFCQSRGDITV